MAWWLLGAHDTEYQEVFKEKSWTNFTGLRSIENNVGGNQDHD